MLLCAISLLLMHDDMILTCAFFFEIAGGLFYFKKDNAKYSLKPEETSDFSPQLRRTEGRRRRVLDAGERNRAYAVGRRGCGGAHHAGRRRSRRRQYVAGNGPGVGHTPPLPQHSKVRTPAPRHTVRACACARACRVCPRAQIVTTGNPHRRWCHHPRHQGSSPLLASATAKLLSSPPLPLPRQLKAPSSAAPRLCQARLCRRVYSH